MASGDIKLRYGTAVGVTITAAALASSTTKLVGRESAEVVNTTNLHQDYLVSGKFTTGTTPTTAKSIELWCIPSWDGTTWPDVFAGADAGRTITNAEVKVGLLRGLVWSVGTNNTSDVVYHFAGVSIAALFGGIVPPKFSFFLTHDTAVNLNATGSNHQIRIQPIFANVE